MVIQDNMSPRDIVSIWAETENIFKKHRIPVVQQQLKEFVSHNQIDSVLRELNEKVGSSSDTCISGG